MPFAHAIATAATTPTPSPTPTGTSSPGPTLLPEDIARRVETNPCGPADDRSVLCELVLDWTGNKWVAASSHWLVAKPVAVLAVIAGAWVIRWLLHRAITKLARRAAGGTVPGVLTGGRDQSAGQSPLLSARRKQRAETMASALKSLTTVVIIAIAMLMVLAEVGLNIGPLLAGAGILGLALGFGSQTLVKDFLSGMFMILEDEYGVGDVVDLGEASGTVEAVGFRVTRLRDVNGTVWYVRNGEVIRVGNKSQGWARAVIDVGVAYGEDITRVRDLLQLTAHELAEDEKFRDIVIEEPAVWGVEALSADAVVIRVVVKTVPLQQWDVARALRERIKKAFDQHRVEIPYPQRSIWARAEGPGAEAGASTPTPTPTPSP